jgi:hypothetical protein
MSLFTRVRGSGILRTSHARSSRKSTQPRSNTYGCPAIGPGLCAFLLACALFSRE